MQVRRGDRVLVMVGKDKGKSGRVIRCLPKKEQVIVERLNIVRRHQKPRPQFGGGGIVEKEAPLHVSKVRLICPQCEKVTRVKRMRYAERVSARVCAKCGSEIRSET